jgi:type II secretory pathway component GspD/PulD (secretin)
MVIRFATCLLILANVASPSRDTDRQAILISLKHRDADDVAWLLERLKSARGAIVACPSLRAVSVKDLPSDVDRMIRIVRDVDEPPGSDLRIYRLPVRHRTAREVVRAYRVAFGDVLPIGVGNIVADDRGNQVIIVATRRGFSSFAQLLADDEPDDDESGELSATSTTSLAGRVPG